MLSLAISTTTATQDFYLVNGYVSADRNKNYWYDFSKIAGGNSARSFPMQPIGRRWKDAACQVTSRNAFGLTTARASL